MSRLDDLPPDQRATLSLLLRSRKSYAEVAALLAIPTQAVHDRAHAALAVLAAPLARALTAERREQVGDYLLGQQDGVGERLATRTYLEGDPGAREWASAISEDLAPLASAPLPEIPSAAPQPDAPPHSSAAPASAGPALEAASATPESVAGLSSATLSASPTAHAGADAQPAQAGASGDAGDAGQSPAGAGGAGGRRSLPSAPSSRVGGALLLAAIVAGVIVAIVLLSGGGGSGKGSSSGTEGGSASNSASSSGTSSSASGSTSTGGKAKEDRRITLRPADPASHAAGVAEVLSEGSQYAFYIAAERLPQSKGKGFFYAVWLYNSPTSHEALSRSPAVGSDGKMQGGALLPSDAGKYHTMLLTRETSSHPTHPGAVVLSGAFSLH
jgi:hypothetical protein